MPLQTLLTGFGSFGNVVDNPTERLLQHFAAHRVDGHDLTVCALPTSFARALPTFQTAFEAGGRDGRPFDFILMLGVAAGSYAWRVETQGRNHDDPRIPDVDGFTTPAREIVPGGAAELPVSLDPSLVAQAVETVGVPVILSHSAGAYLCNHLLYHVLHRLHTNGHAARAGFLHVPSDEQTHAPEDATMRGSVFPFAQHVDVVRAVLSYIANYAPVK